MKKNLNILVLAVVVFCCSILNCSKVSASDGWGSFGDNITWKFTQSTGLLEINGSGAMPEGTDSYEFQDEVPWKDYKGGVQKIIVGEGITSVPDGLFEYYEELKEIQLPSTVKSIGNGAFESCEKLTNIYLPDGLEIIGRRAFCGTGLTSLTIPGTVKEIESSAFESCVNLTDLKINEGVELIGNRSFSDTGIRELDIPSSVNTVVGYAFYNCDKLEFVEIPSSINEIGGRAFYDCDKLASVEIPSSVNKIGGYAFYSCDKLKYVIINAPIDLSYECFSCCDELEVVKLENGVKSIDVNLKDFGGYYNDYDDYADLAFDDVEDYDEDFKEDYEFYWDYYENAKGNGCFYKCRSLKAIYVPQTVSSIDDSTLKGCGEVTFYGYTGTAAWDFAGKDSKINFIDVTTADGEKAWNELWDECVNGKKVPPLDKTNPSDDTSKDDDKKPAKETIKILRVTAEKGSKFITINTIEGAKIIVKMNKKIIKNGSKNSKKITIVNCKTVTRLKLSKKLPKGSGIIVRVSKENYKTRSLMVVVK